MPYRRQKVKAANRCFNIKTLRHLHTVHVYINLQSGVFSEIANSASDNLTIMIIIIIMIMIIIMTIVY